MLCDSDVTTISFHQATWSPDGSKLAFIEYDDRPGQFIFDVIVIDVNDPSLTPTRLVKDTASPLNGLWLNELSWAKHADLLAVSGQSASSPYKDLWCINLNNPTDAINLTAGFDQQNDLNDDDPSWSPSGTQIIFSRGGAAMALNFGSTNGCPASASLSPIATAKGKKSMWGFDWRR